VSGRSVMAHLRSICRTMISMCLSFDRTPCSRLNFLHFVHQMLLQFLRAADGQNLMRIHGPSVNCCPSSDCNHP